MLLGSLTTRAGSSLTFVLCALVFYVRYRRVHLCNSWILALVLSSDDDELSSRCLLLLFAVRICAPSCCFAATPRSRSRLGVHRPFSVACPVAAMIVVVVATFAGSMFAGSMFSGSGCASVRCCVYKSESDTSSLCLQICGSVCKSLSGLDLALRSCSKSCCSVVLLVAEAHIFCSMHFFDYLYGLECRVGLNTLLVV